MPRHRQALWSGLVIDIPRGAANFKMFADTVKNISTETFVMPTPDGAGAINYGLRRPKGVIAVYPRGTCRCC